MAEFLIEVYGFVGSSLTALDALYSIDYHCRQRSMGVSVKCYGGLHSLQPTQGYYLELYRHTHLSDLDSTAVHLLELLSRLSPVDHVPSSKTRVPEFQATSAKCVVASKMISCSMIDWHYVVRCSDNQGITWHTVYL